MSFGPVWLMQPIPYFGEKLTGDWLFEPKIDGWRFQCIRHADGHGECWGRRLEKKPNWSSRLHLLVGATEQQLPKGTLIDCELYSNRGRRFIPSLFARNPKATAFIYVFDVIFLEGTNVCKHTLSSRKQMLAELKLKSPFICIHTMPLRNIKNDFKKTVAHGHEGIVIKKLTSTYLLGINAPIATENWRKVK